MSVVWPQVASRLVQLLPTLTGWDTVIVYDGQPDTADQGDYFAVGATLGDASGGRVAFEPDGSGFFDIETGEVRCELVVEADDFASARTRVFGLLEPLRLYVTQNRGLGSLPAGTSVSLSSEVLSAKDPAPGFRLPLLVSYRSGVV